MEQHEHSIELNSTDLISINRLRGRHFAQVTLTHFNSLTRHHQELKQAAEVAVASSRGIVIVTSGANS